MRTPITFPALLALLSVLAACGRVEQRPAQARTDDTADVWSFRDTARAARAPGAEGQEPMPALPPDSADGGQALLVVVYDPARLVDLNFGDVVHVALVMGYVGRVEPAAGVAPPPDGMPDPWENRLEWAKDDDARAMVRDSAMRLAITAGVRYRVYGPASQVSATVAAVRPSRNACGRPGGIALSLELADALPPGAYYAVPEGGAPGAVGVTPGVALPEGIIDALDTDGDGSADTFLGRSLLEQRRGADAVYRARDPSDGRC
ncbi:MAG TPA: hypothetical protein VJ957_01865 [Longimicrobiales bacterium]|nr:hypothetical protein [Longimicrobiales bacterium]